LSNKVLDIIYSYKYKGGHKEKNDKALKQLCYQLVGEHVHESSSDNEDE